MASYTKAQALDPNQPFDIYDKYRDKLLEMPPGLAAVSALTSALVEHRLTTASEAISLLSSLNKTFKSHLKNPVPASAGTDAFLQYLVTTIAPPGTDDSSDFDQTAKNILTASEDFVEQGLWATKTIAKHGRKLIRDGCVVVVASYDDAVMGLLRDAVEADVRFKIIFVHSDGNGKDSSPKPTQLEVPTATIRPECLAHELSILSAGNSANVHSPSANKSVILLASASAILSNGGVLAPMGTLQACMVGKMFEIRVFIVSETWKSVRLLPLAGDEKSYGVALSWSDSKVKPSNGEGTVHDTLDPSDGPMDVTPPEYITGVVTEHGVRSTAALSEESVKIWF